MEKASKKRYAVLISCARLETPGSSDTHDNENVSCLYSYFSNEAYLVFSKP